MGLERAVAVDEVPPGTLKGVKLGIQELLIANVEGTFYALDDVCLHMGGPLHQGILEGFRVTCPWHEGRYDVRTGEGDPDTDWVVDTTSFPTRVKDGFVYVEL